MGKWAILIAVFHLSLMGPVGCGEGDGEQVQNLGAITVHVPDGWKVLPSTSPIQKAHYLLPKAGGDAEDATLTVSYFGEGKGGSVEANLERWCGQFQQPDGSPSRDRAEVSKRTVSGMAVTMIDLRGTYAPSVTVPGPLTSPPAPKPGYRMLAAILETPQGPYFFKLTGPERTVEQWHRSFDLFIGRIQKIGFLTRQSDCRPWFAVKPEI